MSSTRSGASNKDRSLNVTTTTTAPSPSSARKRRPSHSGPRGVANLTPEQLAKKRSNDREAQRAIRERTKRQIETLERRIQELTSQQPYQELQHVIRQKELVEAENAEIKRRLTTALSILQPLLTSKRTAAVAAAAATAAAAAAAASSSSSELTAHNLTDDRPVYGPSFVHPAPPHIGPADALPYAATSTPSNGDLVKQARPYTHVWQAEPGSTPGLLLPVEGGGRRPSPQTPEGRILHLPANSHITLSAPGPGSSKGSTPLTDDDLSKFSVTSRYTDPSCPLDLLIMNLIGERRQRASEGMSWEDVLGPEHASFGFLAQPGEEFHAHPISNFFTEILSSNAFPDLQAPPEKAAVLHFMTISTRWFISPSVQTFKLVPPWARPTSWQSLTPHPIWIDYLPWPEMRDEMVRNHQRYPFEDFFVPFTKTMSVNWPYSDADILLPRSDGEQPALNPVYEKHIRDLSNWSLGPLFAKELPSLVGTFRLVDKDANGSGDGPP